MNPDDRVIRELLADVVEQSALNLLDPDRLQAIAEDLRVVERRRSYHAGLVTVCIVISALQRSTDTQGRLADARWNYEILGGGPTKESGFRKVARKIAPVLQLLLARRLNALVCNATTPELKGRLSAFRDVLVPDGCAFKLAKRLASSYAGTGNDSELKLHAVYSLRANGLVSIHATAGTVNDNDGFAPQWQPGALYIWDLGYNDYARAIDATAAGALILQRLKSNANPKVVASYGPTGHRRELRGENGKAICLDEACAMGLVHQQRVLDLDVELRTKEQSALMRVVCVPFGGEDRYYLTSLPRQEYSAYEVAELNRLRWEVELFFRGLKGAIRLDEVRRLENEDSLHTIVYGTLLAATLVRDITASLNQLEAGESEQDNASNEAFPPTTAQCEPQGRPEANQRATKAEKKDQSHQRSGTQTAAELLRRRLTDRARISSCARSSAHLSVR